MDILQQISDQIVLGDDEKVNELTTTAMEQKIPVKKIQPSRLKQSAGTGQHQGVGAKVSRYPLVDIAFIFHKLESDNQNKFLVLLDNVLDPQNLGAIIRTAVAVSVDAFVVFMVFS